MHESLLKGPWLCVSSINLWNQPNNFHCVFMLCVRCVFVTLICLLLHSEITYIDRGLKCCIIIVWINLTIINAKESVGSHVSSFFFLILSIGFLLLFVHVVVEMFFFFLNVCCVVTTVTLRMPPKLQMNGNKTCIERMLLRDSCVCSVYSYTWDVRDDVHF